MVAGPHLQPPGAQFLPTCRRINQTRNGRGQLIDIAHRHKAPIHAIGYDFGRPMRAVGADHGGAHSHRLDEDIRKTFKA